MNAVVYDTYHASDNDIVNDNISPSSTNNVTHGDNHPIDTFTNILTLVTNDVMHDGNHLSDDVIPNNDLLSQNMSYVTHGDNHSLDTFTNILTPVMNYVIHDENHSSDDVIPNNDLFSQSMSYVTHCDNHPIVSNVNSSLLVCNNSNIFPVSSSNIVNCEHHHNFHHAEDISNVTFNNVNTMMEVNTAVNDVTDYSDVNRHHTKLNILSLNVCGLRSKLIIPEFSLFISKYDILCFVESKTDETDSKPDLIPGYTSYFNNRKSFRPSGGIVVSVKNNLVNTVKVSETNKSEFISLFNIRH